MKKRRADLLLIRFSSASGLFKLCYLPVCRGRDQGDLPCLAVFVHFGIHILYCDLIDFRKKTHKLPLSAAEAELHDNVKIVFTVRNRNGFRANTETKNALRRNSARTEGKSSAGRAKNGPGHAAYLQIGKSMPAGRNGGSAEKQKYRTGYRACWQRQKPFAAALPGTQRPKSLLSTDWFTAD